MSHGPMSRGLSVSSSSARTGSGNINRPEMSRTTSSVHTTAPAAPPFPRTTVLLVNPNGAVEESSIVYSKPALYKHCGHKSSFGFAERASWLIGANDQARIPGAVRVALFGKVNGKAGTENKYEFPRPIDTTLLFGSCVLVAFDRSNDIPIDLPALIWINQIYPTLMGGEEDLNKTKKADSKKSCRDYTPVERTASGYAKDGFVVDDDEGECEGKSDAKPNPKKTFPEYIQVERTVSGYVKDGFVVDDDEGECDDADAAAAAADNGAEIKTGFTTPIKPKTFMHPISPPTATNARAYHAKAKAKAKANLKATALNAESIGNDKFVTEVDPMLSNNESDLDLDSDACESDSTYVTESTIMSGSDSDSDDSHLSMESYEPEKGNIIG